MMRHWCIEVSSLHTCLGAILKCMVVWSPLLSDPSDGIFGRFDLAALLRLPHLNCLFVSHC